MAWDPGFVSLVCLENIIYWKNCMESQMHYMIFWFTFYTHLLFAPFVDLFWGHYCLLLARFYSQLFCEIDIFLIFSVIKTCNIKSFWCIFFPSVCRPCSTTNSFRVYFHTTYNRPNSDNLHLTLDKVLFSAFVLCSKLTIFYHLPAITV